MGYHWFFISGVVICKYNFGKKSLSDGCEKCPQNSCPQNSMPSEFHNREPPLTFGISAFFGSAFSTWQRLYQPTNTILCFFKAVILRRRATSFTLQRQEKPTACGQVCKLLFKSEFGYKNKHNSR